MNLYMKKGQKNKKCVLIIAFIILCMPLQAFNLVGRYSIQDKNGKLKLALQLNEDSTFIYREVGGVNIVSCEHISWGWWSTKGDSLILLSDNQYTNYDWKQYQNITDFFAYWMQFNNLGLEINQQDSTLQCHPYKDAICRKKIRGEIRVYPTNFITYNIIPSYFFIQNKKHRWYPIAHKSFDRNDDIKNKIWSYKKIESDEQQNNYFNRVLILLEKYTNPQNSDNLPE